MTNVTWRKADQTDYDRRAHEHKMAVVEWLGLDPNDVVAAEVASLTTRVGSVPTAEVIVTAVGGWTPTRFERETIVHKRRADDEDAPPHFIGTIQLGVAATQQLLEATKHVV